MDIVSGDRNGFFNVFIRSGGDLTAYYQYKLMDSTVLTVGYNSQPAVVDWNGDGRKDLLLGTETGYIRFYANQTSDTWPMFQDYTNIEAGGTAIYKNRINPYVFDLDQDSVQDLVCGADNGYVYFFRNTGTNANPVLAAEETLKTTTGTPIQPVGPDRRGSRCGFGDWDNDGLLDFLLSGFEGMVELYRGAPFVGVAEGSRPQAASRTPEASVVRNVLHLRSCPNTGGTTLFDMTGRPVMALRAGANDVTHLATGVYFVRATSGAGKVIIGR